MFRAVFANQKGGVAKTTSAITMAKYFADLGQRVLLVDTDPQGSVATTLGLKPNGRNLFAFLVKGHAIQDCIINVCPNLDVMCSDRETLKAEAVLNTDAAATYAFQSLFPSVERTYYDVVLMDSAPTINLMQNCAAMYCQQIIIPAAMDILSIQGAIASLATTHSSLPHTFDGRTIGLLPTNVDRRLQITTTSLEALEDLSVKHNVPMLPAIRTDALVSRAAKAHQFLVDYDQNSKAYADYKAACEALLLAHHDQFPHLKSHAKELGQTA